MVWKKATQQRCPSWLRTVRLSPVSHEKIDIGMGKSMAPYMRAQHAGTGSLPGIGQGLKKAQEEQPTQTLLHLSPDRIMLHFWRSTLFSACSWPQPNMPNRKRVRFGCSSFCYRRTLAKGGTHGVQPCQGDPGPPCWRGLQRVQRRRFPWDLASMNGDFSWDST